MLRQAATLRDSVVLITGASSGIGAAAARAFAPLGVRLILAARRVERLNELATELASQHNTKSLTIEIDLRDMRQIGPTLESMPDEWKAVDILVNNAGLSRGLSKLHEGNLSDWEEMIDVNVKGLLGVSRTVIPWMVKRNRGHVINIGSIAGQEVYPNGNVYCATKFAVRALNRGMSLDLLGTPIRVSSIDPGLVETEFSIVRFHGDRERAKKPYEGMQPLTGADVADAIVWCATRPPNVNVAEMLLFPTAQRAVITVHLEG